MEVVATGSRYLAGGAQSYRPGLGRAGVDNSQRRVAHGLSRAKLRHPPRPQHALHHVGQPVRPCGRSGTPAFRPWMGSLPEALEPLDPPAPLATWEPGMGPGRYRAQLPRLQGLEE